jgi:uncharacterized protein YecE (DUF72 family)
LPSVVRSPKFQAVAAASLAPAPPHLYTGTSGWAYPSWKPGFYPANVPARAFLHIYAARLTSVEVNYTFRELPTPEQLQGWLEATPPGFLFTFKAPQSITHWKRLLDCQEEVAAFLQSLEPVRTAGRLGVLLFQLPPNLRADPVRLRSLLTLPTLRGYRVAVEFRHESWFGDAIYDLLHTHNAALCVAETDDLITPDVFTAGFRYYRLRRSGGYTSRQVSGVAKRLLPHTAAGDTFVYFKHEDEPTGALNAMAFLAGANRRARRQARQVAAEVDAR